MNGRSWLLTAVSAYAEKSGHSLPKNLATAHDWTPKSLASAKVGLDQ